MEQVELETTGEQRQPEASQAEQEGEQAAAGEGMNRERGLPGERAERAGGEDMDCGAGMKFGQGAGQLEGVAADAGQGAIEAVEEQAEARMHLWFGFNNV